MPPPAHQSNLDVLRALAVLAVVAHHLHAHTGAPMPYLDRFGGLLGVQLFFVLSGYLISASAAQHSLGHYAVHRVMRIFPAYWVAFGLMALAVSWRLPLERIVEHPGAFLLSLANLQQLHAVALLEMDVLSVSWSLTVEVLWYAVAPLVLLLMRHNAWATFLALFVVSTAWTWLANRGALTPLYAGGLADLSRTPLPSQLHVLINSAFPAQLVFFGLGALVYRYRESLATVPLAVWPALALLGLGTLPWHTGWPLATGLISGLGLTALFVWLLRSPEWPLRPLQFTGRISYSIYLLHFPIIVGAYKRFGHLGPAHHLITLALIFGAAWLLYWWVEQPAMQQARRWTRPARA